MAIINGVPEARRADGTLSDGREPLVLPGKTELEQVVERVQQAGITIERSEDGILVRDPSQNGVLLTDHSNSSKQTVGVA